MAGIKTPFDTSSFYLARRTSTLSLLLSLSDAAVLRGSRIEFGAQQCKCDISQFACCDYMNFLKGILVRDEEAVEKLRKEVGEIGLIM